MYGKPHSYLLLQSTRGGWQCHYHSQVKHHHQTSTLHQQPHHCVQTATLSQSLAMSCLSPKFSQVCQKRYLSQCKLMLCLFQGKSVERDTELMLSLLAKSVERDTELMLCLLAKSVERDTELMLCLLAKSVERDTELMLCLLAKSVERYTELMLRLLKHTRGWSFSWCRCVYGTKRSHLILQPHFTYSKQKQNILSADMTISILDALCFTH